MKTTLTFILMLCIATVFAQSTTSTSKPNTETDKPKTKIGSKTDIRNPFDTTKVSTKTQVKNKETGWGDTGVHENNGFVGETEKNNNKATRMDANVKNKKPAVNSLGVGDDPFVKTKPSKTNNLGVGEDPFGKTKKNNSPKKKTGYANQEVNYRN